MKYYFRLVYYYIYYIFKNRMTDEELDEISKKQERSPNPKTEGQLNEILKSERGACIISYGSNPTKCYPNKTNDECQDLAWDTNGAAKKVVPGSGCLKL